MAAESSTLQNILGATLRGLFRFATWTLNLINAGINGIANLFGYKTEGQSASASPSPIDKPIEIKETEKGQATLASVVNSIDDFHKALREAFKDTKGVRVEKSEDQESINITIDEPEGRKGSWTYTKHPSILNRFVLTSPDYPDATTSLTYNANPDHHAYWAPEKLRDAILNHANMAAKAKAAGVDLKEIDRTTAAEWLIDPEATNKLKQAFEGRTDARFTEANSAERKEGHHYKLVIENNGQPETWYMDRTRAKSEDKPLQAIFTKKDDPDFAMHVQVGGLLSDVKLAVAMSLGYRTATLDKADYILETTNIIRQDALIEKQDPANVKMFDLPRDRPIGYLGLNGMLSKNELVSRKYDADLLYAMPELMRKCGYQMVCADDKRVIELKDAPAATIDNNIKVLYDAGVRDFYLNFKVHGAPQTSAPKSESITGNSSLSSGDMSEIVSKYKDCNFTINSTACNAGGLVEMMRDFKDHPDAKEGRVNVFVNTKEWATNYGYYDKYLVKELEKMAEGAPDAAKTYGEAHQKVDTAIKKQPTPAGSLDPEYWKSMPAAPSLRTAQASPAFEDAVKRALSDYTPTLDTGALPVLAFQKPQANQKNSSVA